MDRNSDQTAGFVPGSIPTLRAVVAEPALGPLPPVSQGEETKRSRYKGSCYGSQLGRFGKVVAGRWLRSVCRGRSQPQVVRVMIDDQVRLSRNASGHQCGTHGQHCRVVRSTCFVFRHDLKAVKVLQQLWYGR